MSASSLTDPDFVQRLEGLFLLARRVLGGSLQANRKSRRKGAGITFADYAEYNPGDDYRGIDWQVYARSDELVIRLFELEEDATVYLLLDRSRSMAAKLRYAQQLAAAFGYIALASLDRVAIDGLGAQLQSVLAASHGRGKVLPMLRALEEIEAGGADSDFSACVRSFVARSKRRGLVIVLSDFLFPGGYEEGLRMLRWNRHEVYCLQLLDPAELRCDWKGDVELECVETGRRRRVTVTPAEAARYAELMRRWNEGLQRCCKRNEIGFVRLFGDVPFDQAVRGLLRKGGLVA